MIRGIRETLAVGTAVALVAGCTSAEQGQPTPRSTPSRMESGHRFIADGNKSDAYQAVNCEQQPEDSVSILLPDPRAPYQDIITLGATEHGSKLERTAQTAKLIGGISIWISANNEYLVTASDAPGYVTPIHASEQLPGPTYVDIPGKNFKLLYEFYSDSTSGGYAVAMSCDPLPEKSSDTY